MKLKMIVYIQSNTERTLPHHFDAACALYGAIDDCLDYRLTTYDEVVTGKFDTIIKEGRNPFVGSTEFMTAVFSRAGLTNIKLPRNSNRVSEIITLGEAHERVKNGKQVFIKPVEIKQFTGLVLDGCEYTSLTNIPLDTPVLAYEPFKTRISTEWRIYVHNHKIVDSRNYSADFTINPNYHYINSVIKENKDDFPCAYVIDIGVLANLDNVVIEYNDMWAIGNYGIPNDLYLRLLRDRYVEILKTK